MIRFEFLITDDLFDPGNDSFFGKHISRKSPALSNIVGYEMDKKLAALAAEYELTYTRYADDLTFSGDVFPKERIIPHDIA